GPMTKSASGGRLHTRSAPCFDGRMGTYWSRRLADPIKLASGAELVMLRDAGEFIRDYFQGYLKHDALEYAVELPLAAATTGLLKDRQRATDQLLILISSRLLA